MKFDSLFNRIRVKPSNDRSAHETLPACEWPGCAQHGTHRAPKGRLHERQYWRFCLDHVREYNQSYNYFAGMSDEAVMRYQKDALTGHRPTWRVGTGNRPADAANGFSGRGDPFHLFHEFDGGRRSRADAPEPPKTETRVIFNAERKALHVMGLEGGATQEQVRDRFKFLVKRHHPDANGGDRSSEDRLREIIQAYKYLKNKTNK